MRLNDPELFIWSWHRSWKREPRVTMKGKSSFFFCPPKKVWTSRHWWQSMVSIRNNKTSYYVKMVTKTVWDEREPIIYLPLINLPRNISKGLWGAPGWATPLICVTSWCFLLYIGVYDCCCHLLGCVCFMNVGLSWHFLKLSCLVFLLCMFTFLKHLLAGLEGFLICGSVFMMFIYTSFVQVMFFFVV